MPLSYHDFCFLLSLQAGVVATSTIGFTLMVITFMFNLNAPNTMSLNMQISQYFTLYFYLFIMLLGFFLAFISAFWGYSRLMRISTIIVAVGTVLYIIFSILSYVRHNNIMKYMCPEMRCPDHHWLVDSRWREIYLKVENQRKGGELRSEEGEEEDNRWVPNPELLNTDEVKFQNPNVPNPDVPQVGGQPAVPPPATTLSTTTTTKKKRRKSRKEDALVLIFVSFLYTTATIVFFIFTILTYLSFAKQLDEMD